MVDNLSSERSKVLVKFAQKLASAGVGEGGTVKDMDFNQKITEILEDNIANTCMLILTGLVNQHLKVTSPNPNIVKAINDFNRNAKMIRKMDSIVLNQLSYGHSVIFYDVTKPKVMVYDTSTFDLVHDPTKDEFLGIYQKMEYYDPIALKQGRKEKKTYESFIPNRNLALIPGIGKGHGESVIQNAYPFVVAKKQLVETLPDLVKRLGLLTKIGVDLPGDIGESDVEEYIDKIEEMIKQSLPNSFWIIPKETEVEGVRGSGEAKVIESVKLIIDLFDEEIRKCTFVPDTFLTSLSANRATAKEQRYLISSMVDHIRDLIEESLADMYDSVLLWNGIADFDYEFTWGNINLPEPEILATFLIDSYDRDIMDMDEVRAFLNLGQPEEEIANQSPKNPTQQAEEVLPQENKV